MTGAVSLATLDDIATLGTDVANRATELGIHRNGAPFIRVSRTHAYLGPAIAESAKIQQNMAEINNKFRQSD
jgi:hypothetical protein